MGTGDTTSRAIRYRDLALPDGASAQLRFTPAGVEELQVDTDGDGTFESTVAPTVDVTGLAAEDTAGPVITVSETLLGGSSRITLSAEDPGSGVASLFFSLDGTRFQEYTTPLILDSLRTPILYAFADDVLANRATLVHELRRPPTPIPSMTWWGLVAMAVLVVGLGYVRLRGVRARRG